MGNTFIFSNIMRLQLQINDNGAPKLGAQLSKDYLEEGVNGGAGRAGRDGCLSESSKYLRKAYCRLSPLQPSRKQSYGLGCRIYATFVHPHHVWRCCRRGGDNLILEARIHYAQRCADDVGEIPPGVGALILGDRLGWHGQGQILWHPVKSIGVNNCIREKQYQSTLPFLSN